MRWFTWTLFGLSLFVATSQAQEIQLNEESIWGCVYEPNSLACARKRMANEIDRIEVEVTGRKTDNPISKLIEEGGSLIADGIQAIFGEEEDDASDDASSEVEESRKKKYGKKKKHLHKMIMIGMLLKSKVGLLLQLLSTHFQVKFFVIAILGLVLNAARFWLDLKKSYRPSKVIYYEHAQHQHHYDHDDDHGIWSRSSDEAPQDVAYNAYAPGQH